MEYIHYGAAQYEPEKFQDIKNRFCFVKPTGGLWASPISTENGWKDWNNSNNFKECDEQNSFRFKFKEGSKIAYIDAKDKLHLLPNASIDPMDSRLFRDTKFIDFEQLVERGYDAIEISLTECPSLYWTLYGWDCDSILVLNKDSIEQVN